MALKQDLDEATQMKRRMRWWDERRRRRHTFMSKYMKVLQIFYNDVEYFIFLYKLLLSAFWFLEDVPAIFVFLISASQGSLSELFSPLSIMIIAWLLRDFSLHYCNNQMCRQLNIFPDVRVIFLKHKSIMLLVLKFFRESPFGACLVIQSCLTFCGPMDCNQPGSSVHGISKQEYWSGLPFSPPGDLP